MSEYLPAFLSTDGVLIGTIVPFLFVLTIVVFVHEMGHYLVGRWCGIGVNAFSIGFGPELIGFNDRRGTRWKLCAIPLGGYVKFVGDMNVTSKPDGGEIDNSEPGRAQGRLPHPAGMETCCHRGCRSAVQFPFDDCRLHRDVFGLWPLRHGADGRRSASRQPGRDCRHHAGRPIRQRRRQARSRPSPTCSAWFPAAAAMRSPSS